MTAVERLFGLDIFAFLPRMVRCRNRAAPFFSNHSGGFAPL
jgi:hypothetical protein